jgi:putative sigma-54 modulation protein
MKPIKITGRMMKPTDAIKKYLVEKISKHEDLLDNALLIEAEITNSRPHAGVADDFKLEIDVNLPRAFIKVEDSGSDLYALIDKLENTLFRRLKRYHDMYQKWEDKGKWKLAKAPVNIKPSELESYSDYEPYLAKRKIYDDDSPKHPAEAIEAMELLGHNAFLFRNIENDKYTMVYKRKDGSYGLVEPPNK